MARVHGKDISSINIDNSGGTPADLKAETVSLDFSVSSATHDTTTIGDQWMEFTSGLKGGDDVTHEFMYNNTNSTGIWPVYTGRLGLEGTLSFSDGTRTVSMETIVTKLSLPIAVGDMIKGTATHKITGTVTFS
jgi:hypothetical protein|tara:strand:- start:479 stop:880 length:402 start_codon:yes stop_codon:yes gene_type:complete